MMGSRSFIGSAGEHEGALKEESDNPIIIIGDEDVAQGCRSARRVLWQKKSREIS